jgi:hypothetical protein
VLEHKLDERTTFPRWKGTINGQAHSHRAGCGHDSVPHGDHRDDVVAGGVLAEIWRGRNPRAASARLSRLDRDGHSLARRPLAKQDGILGWHVRQAGQGASKRRAAQRRASHRQGRSGCSRTPLGRYREEPPAVRQPFLLGRLCPRQRDRMRPRLSRLRNGRPLVRGESDRLMRVAAPRSHNLTDAIESLPSGLHRPKHKEHHDLLS